MHALKRAGSPVTERSHHLITLSATNQNAVRELADKLREHLLGKSNIKLGNLAYTYHVGRHPFAHRLTVVGQTQEELAELLNRAAGDEWLDLQKEGPIQYRQTEDHPPKIAFLFSGQGSQSTGMAKELYETSALFKRIVDECVEVLEPHFPVPFMQYLFHPDYREQLNLIHISSVAMFVVEYALAQLWISWGVQPDYVIGHSLGEYAAACVAGGLKLEEALPLVVERGRLMHEGTENGAMLSMSGTFDEVSACLSRYEGKISIATVNGPSQYVVAGHREAVEHLDAQLEQDGVVHRLLPISIASHSPLMEPVLEAYGAFMRREVTFHPMQIPLVSNLTGEMVYGEALSPDYFCRHLRETVQFAAGVETMIQEGVTAFLEIGPHPALKTLVERVAPEDSVVTASLNRKQSDWKTIQEALGALWSAGAVIDWTAFDSEYKRKRVHAPTYAFQQRSHWLEVDTNSYAPAAVVANPGAMEGAMSAQLGSSQPAARSTEELLRGFWQDVLGVKEITLDDNFLQLGGESLNLIQVQSRIYKALKINIDLKDLFANATLRDLVAYVESRRPDRVSARPTEELLRGFWQDVLGVKEIKLDDNFLQLGGESLNLIQVQSRIYKALKINIDLKDLFANATLRDLVALVDSLRTDVRAEEAGIPRAAVQDHYPVSHTQRRMWFLHRMDPANTAYNSDMRFTFEGDLNVIAFQEAYEAMALRHSVLRTLFVEVDGAPRQKILDNPPQTLDYYDIREMQPDDQYAFRMSKIQEDRVQPFHLSNAPSIRAILFKGNDSEFHFYVNQHHIITDTWSMELYMRELLAIYRAYAAGTQPELPSWPLQYIDYAEWHEKEMNSGQLAQEEEYWMQALQQPLPVLDLPTDRPRPEMQTFNGDMLEVELPPHLIGQLREAAAQEDVSLFMVMLSAYVTFLHSVTQEADIIVGTPVLGRTNQALEQVLGYFANSLAIRVQLDGVMTIGDLLQKVKNQSLDAFQHQLYPFDLLVEKLGVERDLTRSPVFSTMFAFNSFNVDEQKEAESQSSAGEADKHTTATFDITLIVTNMGDRIHVAFEYNTDLFDAGTVERFAEILLKAMEAFASERTVPLRSLDLLPAADRALYAALNDTAADVERCTIQEMFYRFAHSQPDRPALSGSGRLLTYRELNERSNQVAHLLRGQGVGRDSIVGIMMERSIDPVIAMLAVLKAGGAYVPIDPEYPEDRVRYMLEDCGAHVLMTQHDLLARLPEGTKAVCIEDVPFTLPVTDLPIENTPDDLAYLIYTSGSTGKPKGTMIRHVGIPNVMHFQSAIGFNQDDVLLQYSSFSFDASALEIYGALLHGAHLHVLTTEERLSPDLFIDLVHELGATNVCFPPVVFNQLVSMLNEERIRKLSSLRTVIMGGDTMSPQAVRDWYQKMGRQAVIVNEYGPTESTIVTTYHLVDEVRDDQLNIPIGKPICNTEHYILNSSLQLCPVGVVGELYIGSIGLATGYINQPDRTAEAFLPHPFSDDPNARIYKTGDLVRLMADVTIEYVGRQDVQVKIRGHRIELSEVEQALSRHQAVQDVVVIAPREDGVTRLVAYYATAEGANVSPDELSEFLARTLPGYMIPSYIGRLDRLPITPNGKIDRRNLPAVDWTAQTTAYVEPRNELERRVHQAFTQCIRAERIGVHDNFFSIGGDSIVSMQLTSRLNQAGLSVKTADIFKHQTIAELAAYIVEHELFAGDVQVVSNEPVTGEVPLSPIQQWLFKQTYIDREFFPLAVVVDIDKPVDVQVMQKAIGTLVTHHDMLRATYNVQGDEVKQVLLPPKKAKVGLQFFDLTDLEEEELLSELTRIELEMKESLRFAKGLLVRASLLQFGEHNYRLILLLHHLFADVTTHRIVMQDLIDIYESLERGLEPLLPNKSTSYGEWVERSAAYINSEHGVAVADYWQPLLESVVELGKLEPDYAGGSNAMQDHRSVAVELDEAVTSVLRSDAYKVFGAPVKDVLLAALSRAVSAWSNQTRVLIGVEGHGRDDLHEDFAFDLSRTAGWFTSIYPFAATVESGQTTAETIAHVRDRIAAMPHGGASFSMLQRLSIDERVQELFNLYEEPEILFNYHGQFDNVGEEQSIWSIGGEAVGQHRPQDERWFKLLVFASILDGRLTLQFGYSEQQYRPETIERLANLFRAELEAIVTACRTLS